MVRNQNLLVIISVLFMAVAILAAKMQKHWETGIHSSRKVFSVAGQSITVAYGPNMDESANLLDLYLPALYLPKQSSTKSVHHSPPYPLIVFVHGGAWQAGDKSLVPSPQEFLERGYVVASINYRLTGTAAHPAQIKDCKTAVAWLRSHAKIFQIDPDHIGVWGISAGGHLAALLGTTGDASSPYWASFPAGISNRVQAVCDWCGPTDLRSMARQGSSKYKLSQAVWSLLRGTPEEKSIIAKEASPVTYVNKKCPPFLIMHGDKDDIVPLEQSVELDKALKAAGANTTLEIIPRANHMFYNDKLIKRVFDFFDLYLKKHQ